MVPFSVVPAARAAPRGKEYVILSRQGDNPLPKLGHGHGFCLFCGDAGIQLFQPQIGPVPAGGETGLVGFAVVPGPAPVAVNSVVQFSRMESISSRWVSSSQIT